MTYSVDTYITPTGFRSYYAKLEFSVPDEGDDLFKTQYNAMHEFLSPISGMTWDDTTNTMTYRIDKADLAFAFDGLVKRSGDDSWLLGDWDVGGRFAITNVRDITIADDSGGQISVSDKLTIIQTGQHGDWVNKPRCPPGQAPELFPSIVEASVGSDYTSTGSQKAYKLAENTTQWQLGLDVIVTRNSDGQRMPLHNGVINALMQCIQ
ncbi:hypothetical type IV pilin PilA [Vibrio variabilis]|uniref:Hypothetical type IV pilin PilA n=1 Tax=Vibrio variabilis TaxID=990271 RepID=A0ABQ0JG45_9VIBR|nr:hypothetical type IV pilin PilA [Vibrio variabilis]